MTTGINTKDLIRLNELIGLYYGAIGDGRGISMETRSLF